MLHLRVAAMAASLCLLAACGQRQQAPENAQAKPEGTTPATKQAPPQSNTASLPL